MAIQTINPATGVVEQTFAAEPVRVLDEKIDKAEQAFRQWRSWNIDRRAAAITGVRELLETHKEQFARLITTEMGKPYRQSLAEIEKCISICAFYATHSHSYLRDEPVATEAHTSYVTYQPMGIVLGIMPWNYPFTQVVRAAIPALMAGNAFILKHASNVPQCARALDDLFKKAGVPDALFVTVLVEGAGVNHLIADERIAAVTVTGGEAAGRHIAAKAGEHLKKVVLELGGSDAFIVLDDVDIPSVVKAAVQAKSLNAGQSCNAPKRFILHQSIAQQFITSLVAEARTLKVGNPMDETTDIGPVAREVVREQLHRQVEESVAKGARLVLGGKKLTGSGFYYEMTVLDNVTKGMPLYDEEVFGPIVSCIEVRDDDEALHIANDTHLGLNATVWTRDRDRATRFITDLHVGTVAVNQVIRSDPRLPYGGVKKSGYGREFGAQGIREFTNVKSVVIK